MKNSVLKHIAIERKRVVEWLLPDLCQIIPSHGENAQISGAGIVTYDTPQPRTWRSLQGLDVTDIPCRMTIERAFVPDKLQMQATVVSRYVLELPASMRGIVHEADRVMKGGRKYEIRKISDQSEWDVTLEMTVVELSVDYDHD